MKSTRGKPKRSQSRKKPVKRRPRQRASIDIKAKGNVLAAEPPINRDMADLDPEFRDKLASVLQALTIAGTPFHFIEGFRTTERQQWLYGSGRPSALYGRPGPILTYMDGVNKRSIHQGEGEPGTGRAADCYPMANEKVYIPPANDPVWAAYAQAVTADGLEAGYNWKRLKDAPHCELPNATE